MKIILLLTGGAIGFLMLLLMGFTGPKDPVEFKASLFDELLPLYPDSKIEKAVTSYTVDACLGSTAAVHILLNDMIPGEAIRFAVTSKGILDKFYTNWYFMIDVPVAENTGLGSRTEKVSGQPNPYVIRKAPFGIYNTL